MAEVAQSIGIAEQLLLIATVRWQIFRNGLRSRSETMHFAGTLLFGIFFGGLAVLGAVVLGIASYALAQSGNWLVLPVLLWGIFSFWQLVPIVSSGMNPGFDGRNLLRFPLRFSAFFLMSAAYGVADPFAATAILWHMSIGAGVLVARPDLFGWVALALALSVAMNLLFNRFVFSWLERVLAKRRVREVFTAVFVLLIVTFQFSGVLWQRRGPEMAQAVRKSAGVWGILPPGLPGTVIEQASAGDAAAALRTSGLLAAWALAFGGLFALRVRAQFTGEDLGESAAPVREARVVKRIPPAAPASGAEVHATSAGAPGIVSPAAAAIFVKEIRYFYRNSMLLMNMVMPLILIVFFTMTSSGGRRGRVGLFQGRFAGQFAYPAAVGYILLLMMNFCPNNLAFEGRGIERLFLAPVKFRDVMLGKNLFHGSLIALESLFALIVLAAMGHAPSPVILLSTWLGLLFAVLLDLGVGNWLSLQFPRRFEFGVRRQRPSGLTTLIFLGVFLGEMGIIFGAALLCNWLAGLWLLPVVYTILSAGALVIYWLILEGTTEQAVRQRDALLEQLTRQA